MMTRRIAFALLTTVALGSGCAKPDWIQDTLVTVDVTGTWQRSGGGPKFQLDLEQQGSRVKGTIGAQVFYGSLAVSGPLEGTVAGDVFNFRMTNQSRKGSGNG